MTQLPLNSFELSSALSLVPPHPDLHEECGVVGVVNHADAAHLTYLGLTALQHRGQESAGIVSMNGNMVRHVGMGLVFDVFKKDHFQMLKGRSAIGHVRYSTSGSSALKNAQPILVTTPYGQLAVGHNGNLTNALTLRKSLEKSGAIFQTTSDSEVLLHLMARSKAKNVLDGILHALDRVEGAYSLVFASDTNAQGKKSSTIIAARDAFGFRPLVLGQLSKKSWVVASETCAFDLIGAKTVREVDPGEVLILEEGKEPRTVYRAKKKERSAMCVFEFVYFSRPDSKIFGKSVYEVRREMGRQLAREAPAPNADYVVAVPDSAVVAALGYSEESALPFEVGFIRSHYVGRTFIEPSVPMRDFRARIKYNPIKEILRGKKIILVDDSIVRGTTSLKLIRMLKKAGVKEIHMRISSPPILGSCFYGIDTPTKKELIASSHSVEQIRQFLGVESLAYLTVDGLVRSTGGTKQQYCTACFSGDYPVYVKDWNALTSGCSSESKKK